MQTIDFEQLFEQMICYRAARKDDRQLGPWLQSQLSAGTFPDLHHIPFKADTYTRNCIVKESQVKESQVKESKNDDSSLDDACFEALIMRWDEQACTPIHGHPQFSFYHVVSGVFEIEVFDSTLTSGLYIKEVQQFSTADATWFSGRSNRYDNCIHRVTCLEPGFTFHIYSEDAKKGIVYS